MKLETCYEWSFNRVASKCIQGLQHFIQGRFYLKPSIWHVLEVLNIRLLGGCMDLLYGEAYFRVQLLINVFRQEMPIAGLCTCFNLMVGISCPVHLWADGLENKLPYFM